MNRHPSEILLSRYADGDLGDGDKKSLESHLKNCKKCRETLACLIKIKNLAETLIPVEVPPGLLTGVKERISRETRTNLRGIWRGALLGMALSSAVALFAILPHTVRPVDKPTGATIRVSEEFIGPPVGLANATSFGQDNSVDAESTFYTQNAASQTPFATTLVQNADYKSGSQASTSKYILVPLDDKARQDLYKRYRIDINSPKNTPDPYFVNLAESLNNGQVVKVKQDVLKQPNRQP